MPGYLVRTPVRRDVAAPVWAALASSAEPASVADLHLTTHAHPNAIQHRLSRWVSAGLVTRMEGRPKRYVMTDATPRTPKPPEVNRAGTVFPTAPTAREKLWRAMRVLHGFDVPTLMMAAAATRRSTEETVNVLHRSGHLRQLTRGNAMKGTWSTYRLVRNTGPKAPKVTQHVALDGTRRREVVDGNTGQRTDISPRAVSLRSKSEAPSNGGGVS